MDVSRAVFINVSVRWDDVLEDVKHHEQEEDGWESVVKDLFQKDVGGIEDEDASYMLKHL